MPGGPSCDGASNRGLRRDAAAFPPSRVFVPCEEHGFLKCTKASEETRCPPLSVPRTALLQRPHLHPPIHFYHIRGDLQKRNITQSWRRRSRTRKFPLHGTNKDLSLININVGTDHEDGWICVQVLGNPKIPYRRIHVCPGRSSGSKSPLRSMGKQRFPSSEHNLVLIHREVTRRISWSKSVSCCL